MMSPMPTAELSGDLIGRARDGDQVAWQILFDQCYPKVVRAVRNRIDRRLRKICDSTDIANEVMKSLAARFDDFDFSSVAGLQAFLIHAARQKVLDGHRRVRAHKRDLARDRPLYSDDGGIGWELADGSPTASQVAVASEEEGILLDGQSGDHRAVLELKVQGFSNSEVSRAIGWPIRKIERFIQNLRGTFRV